MAKPKSKLAESMMSGAIKDEKKDYKSVKDYKNGKKNGQQTRQDRRTNTVYPFSSPYNFVPFSERVYIYPEDKLIKHNNISEDSYTGELIYEVKAESPIFIDDGNASFHRTADGHYSIPGSTMRGLIRNNVQILGLSSYYDDIDDYALMYRHVAKGADKKRYETILGAGSVSVKVGDESVDISVLKKVKAGYIKKEDNRYVIYKTCLDNIEEGFEDMNYYILSERKIINQYLMSKEKKCAFNYEFFIKNNNSIMQHELQEFQVIEKDGKKEYKGTPNRGYKPYFKEISYNLEGRRTISAVGKPGKYDNSGYVISTGKMNKKKVVYIIPGIDYDKEVINISPKDVEAFEIDLNKRANTLKQFGGKWFFDLPDEKSGIKPVFYIQERESDRLYFGFTPRLRLFYDHTIKDGLNKNHVSGIVDYNNALFGNKEFKSKLSFTDAVLQNEVNPLKKEHVILLEPKPTSYLDYLKQGRSQVTYNANSFELRGVKQYWLHKEIIHKEVIDKQKELASVITALPKGSIFKGKIRFKNLSKDELGLLLWSVQLNENSWMNVGKGKPYGYGAVSVKIESVKRFNLSKAYGLDMNLSLNPFNEIDVVNTITYYKNFINGFIRNKTIDQLPIIKAFFDMKDKTKIPHKEKTEYTDLSKYVNRKYGLPEIDKIIQ